MVRHTVSDIKRAQKAALLFRTISDLMVRVTMDDANLQGIYVNRVELSQDKSHCYVYFCALGGETMFNEKIGSLILYKPSLRSAIAKSIPSRYTPEITFKFDTQASKVQRIEELIDKVTREDN